MFLERIMGIMCLNKDEGDGMLIIWKNNVIFIIVLMVVYLIK